MKIGIEGHNLEQDRWGVGHYIASLLSLVAEHPEYFPGAEFYVYFHKKIPGDRYLNAPNIKPRLVKPPFFNHFSSMNLFYHILLPFAARNDKLDIMYYPSYLLPALFLVPGARRAFPYTILVALHDISYRAHPEWFMKSRLFNYRLSLFNIMRNANAILTISKFSKNEIVKYYPGFPSDKIFVNYLAPKRGIGQRGALPGFLERHGITGAFMLFVGQITVRRRVRETIEAFRVIGKEFPELQFLIIGRDRTYPHFDVEARVKTVNEELDRRAIIHIDYVSDDALLEELYAAARVFTYISSYEGYGMPPMEAMLAGTPVVITKNELSHELFDNVAFLVEDETDPANIEDALRLALTDNERGERFKQMGKEIAARYTWEKHARKLHAIFKSLLN